MGGSGLAHFSEYLSSRKEQVKGSRRMGWRWEGPRTQGGRGRDLSWKLAWEDSWVCYPALSNALDWHQAVFSLAFQCSRRGGELDISLRPDGRIDIKGRAVIVLEGTLTA